MSEQKLISPLLDGFVMGPPISSHHGVRCCPAMRHDSDNKYIVKIISIPASQSQLDALLLTGAYKDPGEAMDYFKSLADGITQDADLLLKVSKLEGFLPYDGYQIAPMGSDRLGYLIYLVGSYKRSLDKYIRRSPEAAGKDALKLGLDMCSALSACRRAGALYMALKPTNIFLSEDREFRIGDLGFVSLDSLKYSSLPAKSRSPYCPPEVLDPMQTLNETVDTYALGMILYQLCNGGKLPAPLSDPAETFPSPSNADDKLQAVIMKAIAADPQDRWADPVEMGKALVECLPEELRRQPPSHAEPLAAGSNTQVFSTEAVNAALVSQASSDTKAIPTDEIRKAAVSQDTTSDTRVVPTEAIKAAAADTRVIPAETIKAAAADTRVIPAETIKAAAADTRVIPAETIKAARAVTADTRVVSQAQKPISSDTRVIPGPVSQETKVMSAVGARSKPPVKLTFSEEEYDEYDDMDDDDDVVRSIPDAPRRVRKPLGKSWIIWPLVIILLFGIAYGGYYYYSNYYLQTIDSMTIEGVHDQLTVTVVTDIDESLLTVSCADTYGNSMEQKLLNGKAEFTDLLPNSQYKVTLEIEGFHELIGKTSDVFNTETRTEIVSFTGIAGSEDGSVMLTFTVDGPEPEKWILSYSAEGEEIITEEFTGHSITIRDLAFPKLYTFTLSPAEEMYITGQTSMEFSSTSLIMAKNLAITSCQDGEMTVSWDQPSDTQVESWTVRCYSDGGYDQTIETPDDNVVFYDIDPSFVYYVEVTAEGMTQPARTSITADPITITSLKVDEGDVSKLTISWDHKGEAPDGGWLLMYSLDGNNTQSVVKCSGASAEISPKIPGAEYRFVIQAADSTSIFTNIHTYACPEAQVYKEHSFDASRTTAYLLVTPDKEDWTSADVSKDDYRDTFQIGESISILLFCDNRFYIPSDELSILYVIRNSDSQVVSSLISQATDDWHDLWVAHNTNYGELDLPTAPTEAGSYELSIYFNGLFIASAELTIAP